MPLVKLLNYHIIGDPGQKVEAWGYNFLIRKNGDLTEAVMEMPHVDAEREQGAGRVVIIAYDVPPEQKEPTLTDSVADFFGAGSSAELREQLKGMSKHTLIAFAKKNLALDFPATTGKDALVAQICLKAESMDTKGE